jgi:hypothetical protein
MHLLTQKKQYYGESTKYPYQSVHDLEPCRVKAFFASTPLPKVAVKALVVQPNGSVERDKKKTS